MEPLSVANKTLNKHFLLYLFLSDKNVKQAGESRIDSCHFSSWKVSHHHHQDFQGHRQQSDRLPHHQSFQGDWQDIKEGPGVSKACADPSHEEEDRGKDQSEPVEVDLANGKGGGREQIHHDEVGQEGSRDGSLQEEIPADPIGGHQREALASWQAHSPASCQRQPTSSALDG